MSISAVITRPHTVTLVRSTTTRDAHGNFAATGETRTDVECRLQQDMRVERHADGRNPATELWLMVCQHTDILLGDRFEWAPPERARPLVLEVHGPPEPCYRWNGEYDHTEVTLREVHG